MKSHYRSWRRGLILLCAGLSMQGAATLRAQQTPPAAPQQNPPAAQPSDGQSAPTAEAPPAEAAAPPAEASKRSKDDLEKLVAPIALYPDPLIATVLPASAYPLEIVEAARFVKDTNNVAKIDEQKWDDNVKAVARIPEVISQLDANIGWTGDLGDAFINQPKDLMDAIQSMRTKAEGSGALKTTEQQIVNVTNTVVTNIVQNETVYVTNQVTQIQPAQPEVVYVPQYNPSTVYAGAPAPYPGYVEPRPILGTALTFGAGMAVGAWIANDCDWNDGGCWGGNYHSDVNVNRNVNYNNNVNVNKNANVNKNGQKWQADQNRVKSSGASVNNAQNRAARGYPSGTSQAANRSGNAANGANAANRTASASANAANANAANRNASGEAANRASTAADNKSATGTAANRSSTAGQNAAANNGTRPATANNAGGAAAGSGATAANGGANAAANRADGNLPATGNRSGTSANTAQAKPSPSASSGGSAYTSDNAAAARSSSSRGSASRSSGGGASQGGGGGGGRSGGGGGRR